MSQIKPPTGPLAQTLALVVGAILLVLAFMFSLVLLAAFVTVGLILGAWFFWKTRHVRKAMRNAGARRNPPADGDVIEGEAVIVEEPRVSETDVPPDDSRKP